MADLPNKKKKKYRDMSVLAKETEPTYLAMFMDWYEAARTYDGRVYELHEEAEANARIIRETMTSPKKDERAKRDIALVAEDLKSKDLAMLLCWYEDYKFSGKTCAESKAIAETLSDEQTRRTAKPTEAGTAA